MDLTFDTVNKEQKYLEDQRRDYEPLKRICCDMAYPERIGSWDWQYLSTGIKVKGRKIDREYKCYDATAIKSFSIWSDGILGHYMPKSINWFAEQMADRKLRESKDVIKWLQETDEHMRFVLNQSGGIGSSNDYYSQKLWSIRDAGCIGDSYTFIEEDKSSGKLMFITPHPSEFWVRRDYWGRLVTIHHKCIYTLKQLVDEFGSKALSENQRLNFGTDAGPNHEVTVIHGIYKNKDYKGDSIAVRDMLWQHVYINVEGKHKILQTGSNTLNPVCWSLTRPSNEPYGRGIVSQMLIEILTVNFASRDVSIASQVGARPPMLLSTALKHKFDLGAGGVTFAGGNETRGLKMGDLVARLIDSSGYPFGVENHQRWVKMVEDRFGVSLFTALNMSREGSYKNIEHIRQAQAESAILKAPFLGTLGNATDLEFDRMYDLELNSGRAPVPPQEVLEAQNGRIDIQYIGPLNQLLKQYYETGNLLTTIMNIREVLSISADSASVVEGDELMRKILRSGNTPEELILDKQDVMEIRAIQAQIDEQNRQAELMAKASSAVPNLSKKIEGDSLLSGLVAA